jgi:lysophospholipase L1-like esterase
LSRASQARRLAYGGGGLIGVGATMLGVLVAEAKLARRAIGDVDGAPLDPTGTYGGAALPADAPPVRLALVGDSSAAGFGVDTADQTPAALLARRLSAALSRPVDASSVAQVGARSSDLDGQLDALLARDEHPHVAVVMIGANDVTNRVRPADSVRLLAAAVTRLREADVEVVVGTCPDLGTVRPIRHPLRLMMRRWSRTLAAGQTIAVVEAGGRSVSLGDLLGPEFESRADEMFGPDRFHPSPAGYAAAADALLPAVCAALGAPPPTAPDTGTASTRVVVMEVDDAAVAAADHAGTEVSTARTDDGTGRSFGLRYT